jgi:hypothetical protein
MPMKGAIIGAHPESALDVTLKFGRFGKYLQVGAFPCVFNPFLIYGTYVFNPHI